LGQLREQIVFLTSSPTFPGHVLVYSQRSEIIGSIRAARCAGSQQAISATMANPAEASAKVVKSDGLISKRSRYRTRLNADALDELLDAMVRTPSQPHHIRTIRG
jgi:hypothetical protein